MIAAFEVGSVFKIVDDATPTIFKIAERLGALSKELTNIEERFGAFGKIRASGLNTSLGNVVKKLEAIGEQSSVAKTKVEENFAKIDASATRTAEKLAVVRSELTGLRALPGGRVSHSNGSGRHSSGGARTHRGVTHAGYGGLELSIGSFIAAEGIGHGIEKVIEHGMALEHWRSQLVAAGNSNVDIAKAVDAAWSTAGSNFNTTAAENLKNIVELNKATGNLVESTKLLPAFVVAENVLGSVKSEQLGHKFSLGSTQTLNFARGLEELGVTQMGRTQEEREGNIKRYVQEYLKTMIASRGLFDGNALYAMTNNSGGAAQNWDLRMATTVAPVLGEIMKASKFGNADYMSLKSFQSGKITPDAVAALVKYHLAKAGSENDPSADAFVDDKGKYHLKPNSNFAKGMDTNLWDWSTRILGIMKANGIDINNQHSINAIVNEIGSNKSNSMLMRAILEPLTRLQMQKEFAMRDKVPDSSVGILQEKDPWMKVDALKKKWDDFLTALGGPLIDPAISCLDALTKGLVSLTAWAKEHPDTVKNFAAGLAGAAVVLGATAVVTAAAMLGTGGAIAVAIGTITGAILGLAALHWRELADGLTSFWTALKNFFGGDQTPQSRFRWGRQPSFFEGGGFGGGGGFINASWSDPANDNGGAAKILASTISGGITNSNVVIMGGAGGFGAGSGFAGSFGAFGGGGGGSAGGYAGHYGGKALPVGLGAGIGHVASKADRAAFIRATAASLGIDPEIALRVAQSEGFNNYVGDHGMSFGDFQMYTGGGLGNIALARGINIRDPHNWMAADRLALEIAAHKRSWVDWHGARRVGIGDHQGFGFAPKRTIVGPPPHKHSVHNHHHKVFLDGKQIEASVTSHQAERGQFPTQVGGIDSHGSFASPGTYLDDVA